MPGRTTGGTRDVAPAVDGSRRGAGLALLALLSGIAGCGEGRTPVVAYSPHGGTQLALLEEAFERAHPDLDFQWLDMGSQDVIERLRFEKANPQADVWFGGPSTIFDRGVADSLLQPYRPAWADAVAHAARGAGDTWFSLYRTPAVIVYNAAAVPADSAPRDWDDVLDPRWTDKVLIRDPLASGTMRAIWGFIIQREAATPGDTAGGMAWLRRLDAQTRTYALNPALLNEKLARQEGLVTLWDLPDVRISIGKGLPFGYRFPESGTIVIDDGIGLVRGAPHAEAARRFIDWVGGQEAVLLATRHVFRLPARADLPADSVPAWVAETEREMKVAPMDWDLLSREGAAWMAWWDRHVRGSGRRAP